MSDNEKNTAAPAVDAGEPAFRYNAAMAQGIEERWQQYWDEHGTFHTDLHDFSKPKYYVLDMFLDVPVSWFWMILLGVVLLAIHVVLVYRVALNREEREVVNSCIPGPVRRVFERFS